MDPNMPWAKGSLFDNINAAAEAVGIDNPGIVFGLAQVNWPSPDDRDAFLKALTMRQKGSV